MKIALKNKNKKKTKKRIHLQMINDSRIKIDSAESGNIIE